MYNAYTHICMYNIHVCMCVCVCISHKSKINRSGYLREESKFF